MTNIKFCNICQRYVDLDKDCLPAGRQEGIGSFDLLLFNHTCGTTLAKIDYPEPESLVEALTIIDTICEGIERNYARNRKGD